MRASTNQRAIANWGLASLRSIEPNAMNGLDKRRTRTAEVRGEPFEFGCVNGTRTAHRPSDSISNGRIRWCDAISWVVESQTSGWPDLHRYLDPSTTWTHMFIVWWIESKIRFVTIRLFSFQMIISEMLTLAVRTEMGRKPRLWSWGGYCGVCGSDNWTRNRWAPILTDKFIWMHE